MKKQSKTPTPLRSQFTVHSSLFTLTLLALALLLCMPAQAQRKHGKRSRSFDTTAVAEARIKEMWSLIQERYVESPDMDSLATQAIVAMLKALDPHSIYIPAKDVQKANENLQGNFEGVGISFQIVDDTIHVVEVIEGGPSSKVGILPGDKIVSIDGRPAVGDSVNNTFVSNHLRGPKGSQVTITILRSSPEKGNANSSQVTGLGSPVTENFTITRGKVPIRSIDTWFMANDTVGYIKLERFARTSVDEFRIALSDLQKQGMKSLMLDLRGNSGGFLDIATSLANEFLPARKLIVYQEGRRQPRHSYSTNSSGRFRQGKLVVMIDENSASASEIVSGAVQDWDRGTIVGRRSFGKGLVQRMFSLKDGSQVRLTTARYYTPSGRCIQKPYKAGGDAYRNDIYERYKHGELLSQDSIHFPDSLMFKTSSGRVVYGGGGIMPDVFVPMDTTKLADYFVTLRNKGLVNEFPLRWSENHRAELKDLSFDQFLQKYDSYRVDDEFAAFATAKGLATTDTTGATDAQRMATTENYLHLVLKALIAKNIFGTKYYYQIMKEVDPCYKKAFEVLL